MEEKIIKSSQAAYFQSVAKMFNGNLILTDKRILFQGEHARIKFDHGAVGNIIRDKMEKAMGYDEPEEFVFEIPVAEAQQELRRFGFSKRLILKDRTGHEFSIQIGKKAERDEWPAAIDNAKQNNI